MINAKDSETLKTLVAKGYSVQKAIEFINKVAAVIEKMQNGLAAFSYVKKSDGTHRYAIGTLCLDYIPTSHHPKGTQKTPLPDNVRPYFDMYLGEWRSFDVDNFVGLI
jgi:hypothetical protein